MKLPSILCSLLLGLTQQLVNSVEFFVVVFLNLIAVLVEADLARFLEHDLVEVTDHLTISLKLLSILS